MNDTFDCSSSVRRKLSPKDKVKFSILGNRLGLSSDNAKELLDSIQKETSFTFGLPDNAVMSDVDFLGREFDFVLTVNKQNILEDKK